MKYSHDEKNIHSATTNECGKKNPWNAKKKEAAEKSVGMATWERA